VDGDGTVDRFIMPHRRKASRTIEWGLSGRPMKRRMMQSIIGALPALQVRPAASSL